MIMRRLLLLFATLLVGSVLGTAAALAAQDSAQASTDSLAARRVAPALVFDSTPLPDPLATAQGQERLPGPDEAVDRDGDGIPTLVDFCPDSPPGSRVDQTGCPPEPIPWWVWAGGGVGLLAVLRLGWVPYARWQRRKKLREARIERGTLPGGPAGPFQGPGAPVPWSTQPPPHAEGQGPSGPARHPFGPTPWQPPALPTPEPKQATDPNDPDGSVPAPEGTPPEPGSPSGAEPGLDWQPHPADDPFGPDFQPPAPKPGGWRVGFPAPYAPTEGGAPAPDPVQDPGFPSQEPAARTPLERAVPQPASPPGGGDATLFQSSPADPAGYHHWQDQPLHYEDEERSTPLAWVVRHPLLTLAAILTLGLGGAALANSGGGGGPIPGAPRGVTQVRVPTVVALSDDSVVTAGSDTRVPAALRMMDGDGQVGRVGQTLPTAVAVQVEDEAGEPIPGVPVLFEATVGGGVVSPIAAQTDSSGIARSFWTLGPQVVKQYVVARVAGSEAGVAFEADAAPGLASRVVVVRGDSQAAPPGQMLVEPVVVRVESDAGEPLEGVRIAFATDGGGSANPVEGVSDTLGEVSTVWTLGEAGDTTVLRAEVADAPGIATNVVARLSFPTLPARSGVVAGGTHSCALSPNGNLACWGGNGSGQLGTGGGRAQTPRAVAPGQTFSEVSAGLAYTCGVGSSGIAYCWGDNSNAQLGDGSRAPQTTPRPVAAEVRFRRVAAGNGHTCGISREGSVYCWGSNSYGQLGDGSRSDRDRPTRTLGPSTYESVAVGWFHTCTLTPDGRASCWGRNAFGQLGDGTTEDHLGPEPVAGPARYRVLSAGGAHTCGLGTDRVVYCWGQNNYGQIGDGGNQPRTRPTPVPGGPWRSVTAGGVHTCALDTSGQAFCWGRNTYGQIGDGSTTDRTTPTPVAGGLLFATIQASGAHTCGATASGEQYCWGYNVEGQLGDGSRENRVTPTRVARE